MELEIFVGIAAGCVGAVIAYSAFAMPAKARASRAEARIAELEERAESSRAAREALAIENAATEAEARRVPQLEQDVGNLRSQLETANGGLAEARTMLETERKGHAARVEELEKMGVEIERKFTALAAEALGKTSENFLKLASERFEKHHANADKDLQERQKAIETLVKPLGEGLVKFEHKIGEIEKAREGAYHSVAEQIKHLTEGQTNLRSETNRLVQALRQPKTRGRWGEYQLHNVLEMAGMTEHVDFVGEQAVPGEDGQLRPDVIVRLPGGKSVIVDAKTPLEAYLAAVEANDEEQRTNLIASHAQHVRNHVRALASKDYWKALPVTPDFVVMFVPGEAFFAAAIESDPELFDRATRDRVLIATPTTFIALVKAIAYGWQQQKLAENTQAVVDLANDLFERIKIFGTHMDGLGRALRQAVERYNKGVGSLEGRVLPSARKFESLGAAPVGAEIPEVNRVEIEARELHAPEFADREKTADLR